jgi:hypothetical protein
MLDPLSSIRPPLELPPGVHPTLQATSSFLPHNSGESWL